MGVGWGVEAPEPLAPSRWFPEYLLGWVWAGTGERWPYGAPREHPFWYRRSVGAHMGGAPRGPGDTLSSWKDK